MRNDLEIVGSEHGLSHESINKFVFPLNVPNVQSKPYKLYIAQY